MNPENLTKQLFFVFISNPACETPTLLSTPNKTNFASARSCALCALRALASWVQRLGLSVKRCLGLTLKEEKTLKTPRKISRELVTSELETLEKHAGVCILRWCPRRTEVTSAVEWRFGSFCFQMALVLGQNPKSTINPKTNINPKCNPKINIKPLNPSSTLVNILHLALNKTIGGVKRIFQGYLYGQFGTTTIIWTPIHPYPNHEKPTKESLPTAQPPVDKHRKSYRSSTPVSPRAAFLVSIVTCLHLMTSALQHWIWKAKREASTTASGFGWWLWFLVVLMGFLYHLLFWSLLPATTTIHLANASVSDCNPGRREMAGG